MLISQTKKSVQLTLLGVFICLATNAQNWRTVNPGYTSYFSAGRHQSDGGRYYMQFGPSSRVPDTSLLRTAFITSSATVGTDTIFRFFKSLRDSFLTAAGGQTGCIDTASPTWLGSHYVRRASGIELYFNSFGDTISINTHAGLGDNWILAKDTSAKIFIGSVAKVGVINLNGTLDSFKTISIQALSGTTPVLHEYNNKVLQLSKNHGWLQTLDFYRFPNTTWGRDANGIAIDSSQHLRISSEYIASPSVNAAWKFTPGNEWIIRDDYGWNDVRSLPDTGITQHDSVLSYLPLSLNSGLATIRSIVFKQYHHPIPRAPGFANWSSLIAYTHADTVHNAAGSGTWLPEVGANQALATRYFIQPYDTTHWFTTLSSLSNFKIAQANGCLILIAPIGAPDDNSAFDTYLSDFGQTSMFIMNVNAVTNMERYWRHRYIKTGTTIYGQKINVSTLAVGQLPVSETIIVSPVPANNAITLRNLPPDASEAVLFTPTGQTFLSQTLSGNTAIIPTLGLPDGLYFLEITGKARRQIIKVLVQH